MKMRSLSVVGLCFLLMVGFSGQVGADDICYCLNKCDVPFTHNWNKGYERRGVPITCEEECETPLAKDKNKSWEVLGDNKAVTKQSFTSILEKRKLQSKERIKRLEKEFGYKELKMGMLPVDIETLGVCNGSSCFNKKGWNFYFGYGEDVNSCNSGLNQIFIDVGPYSSDFHQELFETLGKRYEMSQGMTDRNIELYNSGELKSLNVVYRNGALGLQIYRQDNNHRIGIVYYDESQAKLYLKANQPQKADDF